MSMARLNKALASGVRGTLNVTQKTATYGHQVVNAGATTAVVLTTAVAAAASDANFFGVTVSNPYLATAAHGTVHAATAISQALPAATLAMGVMGLVAAADDFLASFTQSSQEVELTEEQCIQHIENQLAKYNKALKKSQNKQSAESQLSQFGLEELPSDSSKVKLTDEELNNLKKSTLRSRGMYNGTLSMFVTGFSYLAVSPGHIPGVLASGMTACAIPAMSLGFVGLAIRSAIQLCKELSEIKGVKSKLTTEQKNSLASRVLQCAGFTAMVFNPYVGAALLAGAAYFLYQQSTLRRDTAANFAACKSALFNVGAACMTQKSGMLSPLDLPAGVTSTYKPGVLR